jgi:hypothetical protein
MVLHVSGPPGENYVRAIGICQYPDEYGGRYAWQAALSVLDQNAGGM